jgi:hypothetical protein
MTIIRPRTKAAVVAILIGSLGWLAPVIALIAGIAIYGGGNAPGDGGPDLSWIVSLIFGAIATGALGIIGSLICVSCGSSIYPDERRAWILPKVLNYPLGLFGIGGALIWLISRS